jgi:hypothetical protein
MDFAALNPSYEVNPYYELNDLLRQRLQPLQ